MIHKFQHMKAKSKIPDFEILKGIIVKKKL